MYRSSQYGEERAPAVRRGRQAFVREDAGVAVELDRPVRLEDGRRVRVAVDVDRERERDRGRAVVAVVSGVLGARHDRLAGLGRDRVVRAWDHRNREGNGVVPLGRSHGEAEVQGRPADDSVRDRSFEPRTVRSRPPGRDVRVRGVRLGDRHARARGGDDARDARRGRASRVPDSLVELEGLARLEVAVAVLVVNRCQVVDQRGAAGADVSEQAEHLVRCRSVDAAGGRSSAPGGAARVVSRCRDSARRRRS